MNEVEVHIEAEINPTEDHERVKKSVGNIISDAEFEVKPQERGSLLKAEGSGFESLTKFFNLLRRERILDAARNVLFKGLDKNSITFYLNKQVAYVGHISFSEPTAESTLGPIKVQIFCDNPRSLIEWLTPKTIRKRA